MFGLGAERLEIERVEQALAARSDPTHATFEVAGFRADLGMEATRVIELHRRIAKRVGVTGTPHTFINGLPMIGAVGYDALRDQVLAARARAARAVSRTP